MRRRRKSSIINTKKSFSLLVSLSLLMLMLRLFFLLLSSSWSSSSSSSPRRLLLSSSSFRDENYYFDVMMGVVGGVVGSCLSSVAVVTVVAVDAFALNNNQQQQQQQQLQRYHRYRPASSTRTKKTTTMKLQSSSLSFEDVDVGLSFDTIQTMARKRYNNNNNNSSSKTTQLPMNGRVIVITGAAGGIGSELTQLLYKLGATIIALDRNSTGLHELQNSLIKNEDDEDTTTTTTTITTSTTQQQEEEIIMNSKRRRRRRIVTKVIRQEDLLNVANIANGICINYPKIDLLINNAGLSYSQTTTTILGSQNVKSSNGYDLLFTVNYLSHFLLTEKLLPNLSNNNKGGRIVHITSTFHWKVDGSELLCSNDEIPLAYESNINKQGPDHLGRSYANSKLAQIWYSHYINRNNHQKNNVNVINSVCACPTWAATGIAGDEGRDFLSKFAFPVENLGRGMTSIINACLRTDEELGNAVANGSQSLVANCHLMDYLIGKESWLRWPIWRDNISGIVAIMLLVLQKYTYSEFIIQKTSPESCDITKQNQFYDWSKKQISSYLIK